MDGNKIQGQIPTEYGDLSLLGKTPFARSESIYAPPKVSLLLRTMLDDLTYTCLDIL